MVKKVWEDPKWQAREAAKTAARKAPRAQAPAAQLRPQQAPYVASYGPGYGAAPQQMGYPLPHLAQTPAQVVPFPGQPTPKQGSGFGGLARKRADETRKAAWRYRWQLAPFVATGGLVAGASLDPLTMTGTALAAAAGMALAQHKGPDKINGRTWLSRRERGLVAKWAAAAAAWSGVVTIGMDPISMPGLMSLAVGTSAQTVCWWMSRQVRPAGEQEADSLEEALSERTKAIEANWPQVVAALGPSGLRGSRLIDIKDLRTEEGELTGTSVLTVELRRQVHAHDVVNETTRLWLERELEQGIDTVQLQPDRDHSGRLTIVLTPERHLETTSKLWDGPIITEDGRIPVAVTPAGDLVYIRLWASDGVRHLVMVGSSGSGKTNAYNVMLLPGVLAGKEVLIYVDGKRGTSSPELAPAMDMVALKDNTWGPTIEMVYNVMVAREDRYGDMGISKFDVNGPDPIVALAIDEGHTVKKALTPRQEEMVEEISERGRALGVVLKLGVQRPTADHVPGGMNTRENLMGTAGNVVGLRPGGAVSKSITLSATSADIDLLGLPEGPGWAAILSGGGVMAEKARFVNIPDPKDHPEGIDLLAKHMPEDFVPDPLRGADAIAAGETYRTRTTGAMWLARMAARRAEEGRDQAGVPSNSPTVTSSTELVAAGDSTTVTIGISEPADTITDVDVDVDETVVEFPHLARVLTGAAAVRSSGKQLRITQVINVLGRSQEAMSLSEVARITEIPKATAHRLLGELAQEGQITKTEDGLWQAIAAENAA